MENKKNIYDLILKNKEVEVNTNAPAKMEVNADTFFTDDCKTGHVSKHDFLVFMHSLEKNDFKALDHLFSLMNDKQKFNVSPFEKLDSKKRPYIWVSQNKINTDTGFKVFTVGNLWHLVNLYGFDLVNCDLTVEALYLKATA